MIGVALLLLAATIGHSVARRLGSPAPPFLVFAGLGLAASGLVGGDFLAETLLLGITFMVFVAGIELDPGRVGAQRRAALVIGTVQFLALGALGLGAATLLGFGRQEAVYLALALTASSTLVVVRVLQRRRQLFEPFGRLVIGVLLLQDLLVILLIPVLTELPSGGMAVLTGVAGVLALTMFAWVLQRGPATSALRALAGDRELLLLAILSHLFVFLLLADLAGIPLVAGAFLAGVSLSSFPVNGIVRGQLTSISDFFSAIFFTALGASVGVPMWTEVAHAAVFAVVVLVVTPVVVVVLAERTGLSARPAILSGLLLSQTSEFSLVVGLQGVALQQISPGTFRVVVLVTLGTMVLTPFLVSDRISLALLHLHPFRSDRRTLEPPPSDHVVIVGCGTSGMPLLETLVVGPHPVVAVDDDPGVVARLRDAGLVAVRGDATDPELLRRIGVDRARVVVSTVRRKEDNAGLLAAAGDTPVIVRVFNEEDARWITARGGEPVTVADAAASEFMEWFDRRGWETLDDLEEEELEDVL
jgi:CPA2 family monovalent cation:H+ antiporter-2